MTVPSIDPNPGMPVIIASCDGVTGDPKGFIFGSSDLSMAMAGDVHVKAQPAVVKFRAATRKHYVMKTNWHIMCY